MVGSRNRLSGSRPKPMVDITVRVVLECCGNSSGGNPMDSSHLLCPPILIGVEGDVYWETYIG